MMARSPSMRGTFKLFAAIACVISVSSCQQPSIAKVSYPTTGRGDVVDNYFGRRVSDPYRWMEDLTSKAVADWVAAENQVTFAYLAKLPMRDHFQRRITELWNYPKVAIPVHEGGRFFYTKNAGLQRQAPLYMRSSLAAAGRLVLDPNTLSPDGSISLAQWQPSHDGRFLAYGLSEGGADWRTVHVRDVDADKDLRDEVHWMRFSEISWTNDAKGFFYSRYPEPPPGRVLEAALSHQAVYYHRIGSPQSDDRLIYERQDLPTWFLEAKVTDDGRYLIILMADGSTNNNRVYYSGLGDPKRPAIGAPVRPLIESDGAEFAVFGNQGSVLYLRTDQNSPKRKVIAVDIARPAPADWKTIIPERGEAIESVALIGGRIVAQYLVDVQSRLMLFGIDGAAQGEVPLPGSGTVVEVYGRQDSSEIFYSFSSPLYPTTVFVYDLDARGQTPFEPSKPPIDVDAYETKPLFAVSRDGTRVPFFLTWKKGLSRDGTNPTMVFGYGGFSVSVLPQYFDSVPAWLELGGVWVTVSLRGGGEYGEAWHRAGILDKKQNVFDDFIAVAEYLVKHKYTSPARLSIKGRSNGGLMIGAVEEQRPDLYAVALPEVGVMDMLRFGKFTGGRAWVTEYGSSSNAADFAYLIKYSPLHNVKPGVCYPATLVTTADHDDRVVPSHSFKFTAAMQAAQACDHPVLIRVETQGSHRYRPTDKQIAELADEWAFVAMNMGMRTP